MEALVKKYIDETGLLPRFYTGLLSYENIAYTADFINWIKRYLK